MENLEFPTTAGAIARSLGAELVGDPGANVLRLGALEGAGAGTLCFFANRKYGAFLGKLRDAVVFTSPELLRADLPLTFIVVPDPQLAFAGLVRGRGHRQVGPGISELASIHPEAEIAAGVCVGPFAVIAQGARVGEGSRIFPHAYVGTNVTIGRDCEIHSHVTVWDGSQLGDRVKVFAGAVIGSDGFGFVEKNGRHEEVPQVGTVVIENDVRIGANCTIDRGTLGETRIGEGTKLDNLVHVGHNCRIGKHVILCAQVGIAGSVVLEDGVVCGGQVGLGQGITLARGSRIGAQAGVGTNTEPGETYFQSPAVPMREALRIIKYMRKLPQIWKRLGDLEEKLSKS